MLITLFNYYGKSNIMGMDAIQVYIADKYYLRESWWSDAKFFADLKDRVEKTRPLLIGKMAPDVELMLFHPSILKVPLTDTSLRRVFPMWEPRFTSQKIKAKYLVLFSGKLIAVIAKSQFPNYMLFMKKALKTWVSRYCREYPVWRRR